MPASAAEVRRSARLSPFLSLASPSSPSFSLLNHVCFKYTRIRCCRAGNGCRCEFSNLVPPFSLADLDSQGFLASHVSEALMRAGYRVRGTSRSEQHIEFLRKKWEGQFPGLFESRVVEDLVKEGATDDALQGESSQPLAGVRRSHAFVSRNPTRCLCRRSSGYGDRLQRRPRAGHLTRRLHGQQPPQISFKSTNHQTLCLHQLHSSRYLAFNERHAFLGPP